MSHLSLGFVVLLFLPLWLFPSEANLYLSSGQILGLWWVALGLHEIAHSLVWRLLGYRTHCVFSWRGPLQLPKQRPYPFWMGALPALAGPLASFLAAWIFSNAVNPSPLYQLASQMNLIWGLWQLCPIARLDGRYILDALLESMLGYRGLRLASLMSFAFCLILAAALLWMAPSATFLPSALAIFLSFQAWMELRESWHLGNKDVERRIESVLLEAMQLYKEGKNSSAQTKLRELIHASQKRDQTSLHVTHARLLLAQWLLETGQAQNAWELVKDLSRPKHLKGPWLVALHQVAYQSENFDRVVQLAAKAFYEKADASVAMMNAIACARLHQSRSQDSDQSAKAAALDKMVYEAVGWLRAAHRLHFQQWSVLQGPDFASLKGQTLFDAFAGENSCDSSHPRA